MILAIDPGNEQSAYILTDNNLKIIEHGKCENEPLKAHLNNMAAGFTNLTVAIEMIASYGMPVGKEVFETCLFIGQLQEFF